MNAESIQRAFADLGARLQIEVSPFRRRFTSEGERRYELDIAKDRHGQYFKLSLNSEATVPVEVQVLHKVRAERHLLLLVKQLDRKPVKHRFLCGFDEREWFAAGIIDDWATTVSRARDSLKPSIVHAREYQAGVRVQHRHQRHNLGSIRQGEWFFLPEPRMKVPDSHIIRSEPIIRVRVARYHGISSKPHIVEELYRTGGEVIYTHPDFPWGLTAKELEHVLATSRKLRLADFRQMRRNAGVYARGKVSHPDHKTIVLNEWHQVLMNAESNALGSLRFID